MSIGEYKLALLVSTVIVTLLVASPAIQMLMASTQSTPFSEIGLLGPDHNASGYPFYIRSGENYNGFLEVGNHEGQMTYYMIQVKFLNQPQLAAGTIVPSLGNSTFFVADQQTWELPVTFSLEYIYNDTLSQVKIDKLNLNNASYDGGDSYAIWDTTRTAFVGYLVFELWMYNITTGEFQNHERSINLVLNLSG